MNKTKTAAAPWLFLALTLLVNFLYLHAAMPRTFNLFDYDSFTTLGWRILNGQNLYTDVAYHNGPIFPAMIAFFIALFGFHKNAFEIHLLLMSSLPLLGMFLFFRKKVPFGFMSALVLITMLSFYWEQPFPNYTQDATVWAIFVIMFIAEGFPYTDGRQAFRAHALGGFLTVLSFFTKANTGAGLVFIFTASLAFGNFKRSSLKGLLCGTFLGSLPVLILMKNPWAYYEDAFVEYTFHEGDRLKRFLNLRYWLANYYWYPLAMTLAAMPGFFSKLRASLALNIACYLCAILALVTSSRTSDTSIASEHIPFWGMLVGMAVLTLHRAKNQSSGALGKLRINIAVLMLIIFGFFHAGFVTYRNYRALFAEQKPPDWILNRPDLIDAWKSDVLYRLETQPLKGWLCRKVHGGALDALTEFINKNIRQDETLLVFCNLQMLYPLTRHKPFPYSPFQYYPPNTPAKGRQTEELKNSIMKSPPAWVVGRGGREWRDNMEILSPYFELNDFFEKNYFIVWTYGGHFIKRKKYQPPLRHPLDPNPRVRLQSPAKASGSIEG